jgi:hypothetical protein
MDAIAMVRNSLNVRHLMRSLLISRISWKSFEVRSTISSGMANADVHGDYPVGAVPATDG